MAKTEKTINIWEKYQNPLRDLTSRQIENIFNQANHGNDIRLQLAYSQIELAAPIFKICIDKRTSGIIDREWAIETLDDSKEAANQKEVVEKVLRKSDARNDDGLTEAMKHLALASFRGRSAVKPFFDENNDLYFKKLQNWNILNIDGKFYWNPQVEEVYKHQDVLTKNLVEVPKKEICYLLNDKPTDYAGITIYLRSLIGETKWAKLVEKTGIPQVLLTVPDGTPDQELQTWNYRAQAIFDGASGCLPASTTVTELTSGRNGEIFQQFLTHQDRLISILATGGTALTLGDTGGGLGSDLVREQKAAFEKLVSQDCKQISNALSNSVIPKILRHILRTDKQLVRFTFVESDATTPNEYLDMALKLQSLGAAIDINELKRLTKLPFIKDA